VAPLTVPISSLGAAGPSREDRAIPKLLTLLPAVALVATLGAAGPSSAQDEPLSQIHIGLILPEAGSDLLQAAVARAADQGAVMAQEEFALNAEMFAVDFAVETIKASGEGVLDAAQSLLDSGQVFAIAGGFTAQEAELLSGWSAERGIPFANLQASEDRLRNEECAATSFHVAPSAAMYLDSLAGWYVRAGFRNWFVVQAEGQEAADQYRRLQTSLTERHFGAREVGHAQIAPGAGLDGSVIDQIRNANADLVVLLTSAQDQLSALSAMEAAGLDLMVTGFPYPEAQTRAFFTQSAQAAPVLGSGMRATAWEPTLDAYGARELNARYMDRFGEPMEGPAWAAYQGVKVFFEAAMFSGSTASDAVLAYLTAPTSVFDVWKGIGTSFRPWDHQLRQPLYLSKIDPDAADARLRGQLVGELPAIYMPGTDPVERLDQMGDLAGQSHCRF